MERFLYLIFIFFLHLKPKSILSFLHNTLRQTFKFVTKTNKKADDYKSSVLQFTQSIIN